MNDPATHPVINDISNKLESLTPKAQTLGTYIMQHPTKAVFMTTKELAGICQISEATVVRFVSTLGYKGYSDFQEALKDFVNTGLSLPERIAMKGIKEPGADRFHRGILEELNNLKYLYENINVEIMNQFVDYLNKSQTVYVIGSRLSYTFAYYLGWSLTRIRKEVHILKGSDTTTFDMLANAPSNSLVILTIDRIGRDQWKSHLFLWLLQLFRILWLFFFPLFLIIGFLGNVGSFLFHRG